MVRAQVRLRVRFEKKRLSFPEVAAREGGWCPREKREPRQSYARLV